jgi:hypothetical protein
MKNLSGEQNEQLHSALLSAFPTVSSLEKMVRFRLSENLMEIVKDGSVSDLAFNLIQWAEAGGRMEDLVRGALKEQPRNEDLQIFAAQVGLVAAKAPVSSLGAPARGKLGILVDLSHGQAEWGKDAIFSAAKGQLARMLVQPPKEPPWDLREIRDRRHHDAGALNAWSGLLLGIPNHERIEDSTRREIVNWVRGGGRLVLLGFELGERHHETNLNELAGEFGLRFNSDIAAPASWLPPGKPYSEPVDFTQIQSTHPVMKGVNSLRLSNLCTLTVEPGADILLPLGKNSLCRLGREGVKYTSQGWLRGGRQVFEVIANADWVPVIAEAPAGLTGQGKVLAVGTWEIFGSGYDFPAGFDNCCFIENMFNWLGGA